MDTRKFFERGETIDEEMASKNEMITVLRERAEHITSSLSGNRVQNNGSSRRMADSVDMIADLQLEIEEQRKELCRTLKEILNVISGLDDPTQRTLMEQRYICGKSIYEIAKELHVSERTAYRIHDDAMEAAVLPEGYREEEELENPESCQTVTVDGSPCGL